MTATPSIAELLPLARQGDRAALEALFLASLPYLHLLARSRIEHGLQAKFDGSDLVQQTLLEAFRGFPGFQGGTEAEWLAWLRKILAHNATDWVRDYRTGKRRAQDEVPLAGPGDSFPGACSLVASGSSPSRVLLRKEQELRLADALDRLPEDYRDVILLRNLERLPFSEIATRMGRSRPAVQMLWMRALVALQELLG
jgi:RNA polymerase sigma-70 factor (ECF subfamily)